MASPTHRPNDFLAWSVSQATLWPILANQNFENFASKLA